MVEDTRKDFNRGGEYETMLRGFLVDRLSAERGDIDAGEVSVNYTHKILEVKSIENEPSSVEVRFNFRAVYLQKKKSVGSIEIDGRIVWEGNSDKILSAWSKKKEFESSIGEALVNAVYHRSLVLAMSIVETIKLPSVLPLPKVTFQSKDDKKGKSE